MTTMLCTPFAAKVLVTLPDSRASLKTNRPKHTQPNLEIMVRNNVHITFSVKNIALKLDYQGTSVFLKNRPKAKIRPICSPCLTARSPSRNEQQLSNNKKGPICPR
jgi:hypothetical protein